MSPRRIVIEISSSSEEEISPKCRHKRASYGNSPCAGKGVSFTRIPSPKKRYKKKRKSRDLDDDCIILDSDPEKRVYSGLSLPSNQSPKDLLVVAEHGPVACRDYPHARHLCAKFHFKSTSHHRHCELCYCYVCDIPAPCTRWNNQCDISHCHASDKEEKWKIIREMHKLIFDSQVLQSAA